RRGMRGMGGGIRETADASRGQDRKGLTTLPGVGAATAEQIIATLRRKVTKYALMTPAAEETADGAAPTPATVVDGNVMEDVYQALMSVGHSPQEAGNRLDKVLATGKAFKSVEEVLLEIYKGE